MRNKHYFVDPWGVLLAAPKKTTSVGFWYQGPFRSKLQAYLYYKAWISQLPKEE